MPEPIYALGDIHGQAEALDRALRLIEVDGGPDARIVFLGDYTDRGPDSRGVLDRLIAGRDAGRPWRFVRGNHDKMFLAFLTEGEENDIHIGSRLSWMNARLGGPSTLASYGLGGAPAFLHAANGGWETLSAYEVECGETMTGQELVFAAGLAIPETHRQFLATTELWVEIDDLLFVHAGIRPGIAMAEQEEGDLLWIREGWLEEQSDHGPLIVHGHTAVDFPEHHGNRVNLDCGAGYGRPLVPALFEGRDTCWTLDEYGRTPLRPHVTR